MCCHVGGNIDFDIAGNLYLSTGDDSNPFFSDGYAPIDDLAEPQPGLRRPPQRGQHERPARQDPADPAQDDGGYTIPKGNLFPKGKAKTKPEIYAMGLRNPYRFGINRPGDLYVGDYSPDAGQGRPGPGPGRPRPLDHHQEAGQLWLAVLRRRRSWRTTSSTSRPSCPGRSSTARAPTQRLAAQHRAYDAAAGRAAGPLVLVPASPHFPELEAEGPEGDGGIAPMGGPAYTTTRATSHRSASRTLRRQAAVLRVDARLHQG